MQNNFGNVSVIDKIMFCSTILQLKSYPKSDSTTICYSYLNPNDNSIIYEILFEFRL